MCRPRGGWNAFCPAVERGSAAMLTRYWDRRRFIRLPVGESARWRSGRHHGPCELLDISPAGCGLRMSARGAKQLGARLTVEIEYAPGVTYTLVQEARVVRSGPARQGTCAVGVQF
jgi:hypothetical protein